MNGAQKVVDNLVDSVVGAKIITTERREDVRICLDQLHELFMLNQFPNELIQPLVRLFFTVMKEHDQYVPVRLFFHFSIPPFSCPSSYLLTQLFLLRDPNKLFPNAKRPLDGVCALSAAMQCKKIFCVVLCLCLHC